MPPACLPACSLQASQRLVQPQHRRLVGRLELSLRLAHSAPPLPQLPAPLARQPASLPLGWRPHQVMRRSRPASLSSRRCCWTASASVQWSALCRVSRQKDSLVCLQQKADKHTPYCASHLLRVQPSEPRQRQVSPLAPHSDTAQPLFLPPRLAACSATPLILPEAALPCTNLQYGCYACLRPSQPYLHALSACLLARVFRSWCSIWHVAVWSSALLWRVSSCVWPGSQRPRVWPGQQRASLWPGKPDGLWQHGVWQCGACGRWGGLPGHNPGCACMAAVDERGSLVMHEMHVLWSRRVAQRAGAAQEGPLAAA